MDVYATEEQQIEEIKKWWKENGLSIVAGVVLGLGAIFGWRAWQSHLVTEAEAASMVYQKMTTAISEEKTDEMRKYAGELLADYPATAYAVFAKLFLAKQAVDDKQPAEAEEHLRWALDNSKDDSLTHEIRLRLARVMAAQEKFSDALALLDITDKGAYSGHYDEVRGDILTQQGDIEGARAAYQQAQTKFKAAGTDTAILEMKLDDIGRIDA